MRVLRTAAVFVLFKQVSSTDPLLSAPVTCYLLDGFLLLYCIVFTCLYFREKLLNSRISSSAASNTENDANVLHEEQNPAHPSSVETPTGRQEARERVYQTLGDVESDPYQMIESNMRRVCRGKKTKVQKTLNLEKKSDNTCQPLVKRRTPPSPPAP